MLRFSKAKVISTIAFIVIGLLLGVPSLIGRDERLAIQHALPSWLPAWIVPTRAIVLGLDLQGGSHVLLEVDTQDLIRSQTTQLRDDVRRVLREANVNPQGGSSSCRAACRCAFPTRRSATAPCRSCRNCRSRSATR